MASDLSQSPNHKQLNPHASPYQRSTMTTQTPVNPERQPALLNNRYLPHEIYSIQPQSPPIVTLEVPYITDYCIYHQPRPDWAYQSAFVYYNNYRQPFAVSCGGFAGKGAEYYNTGAQPTLCNMGKNYPRHDYPRECLNKIVDAKVNGLDDYGSEEKGVVQQSLGRGKRVLASRLRPRKGDLGFSCEKSWIAKNNNKKVGSGSSEGSKPPNISDNRGDDNVVTGVDDVKLGGKTTLMIRNIPNQFVRCDLLRILDKHCLEENKKAQLSSDPIKSQYDFLYLPMDFRRRANLGYAFVNFTDAVAATRFSRAFHKFEWKVFQNKKTCEISSAVIQGKGALINHFKNSSFACHTDCYLPVVLSPPRDGMVCSRPQVVGCWRSTVARRSFANHQRNHHQEN